MSQYSHRQIYGSHIRPIRQALSQDPYANQPRPKRTRSHYVFSEESHPQYDSKTGRIENVFLNGDLAGKTAISSPEQQDNLSQPIQLNLSNPVRDVTRIKLHRVDLPLKTNVVELPYLPRTVSNKSIPRPFYRFNYTGTTPNSAGDGRLQDSRMTHYDSTTTAVFSFECMIRPRFGSSVTASTQMTIAHTGTNANLPGFVVVVRKHAQNNSFYPYIQARAATGAGAVAQTIAANNQYFNYDQWMHLLVVKDNTGARIYINGTQYDSRDYPAVRTDTSMTHSAALTLGGGGNLGEFIGDIGYPRYWQKDRSMDTNWYAQRFDDMTGSTNLVQQGIQVNSMRFASQGMPSPTFVFGSPVQTHCHYALQFRLGYKDINGDSKTASRIVNIYPLAHYDNKESFPDSKESSSTFDVSLNRSQILQRIVEQIRTGLTSTASAFYDSHTPTYIDPIVEYGPTQNLWPFVDLDRQTVCMSVRPHPNIEWWSVSAIQSEDNSLHPQAPTNSVQPSQNILRYLGFPTGELHSSRADQYGWIDRTRFSSTSQYLPSDYVIRGEGPKRFKDDIFLRITFGGGSNAESGSVHQTTGVLNIAYAVSKHVSEDDTTTRHIRWLDSHEGIVDLQYPLPVMNRMTLQWTHRDGTPVQFQGQQGSFMLEFMSI